VAAIEVDYVEALMEPGDVVDAHDLLRVLLHRPAWQREAACAGGGAARWFPRLGEDPEPGKVICRSCPVRVECLEYALDTDAQGFWAGTSQRARARARRRGLDATGLLDEIGA
jgi:WhiB family redox-sensing transcriptional regulator